MYARARLGDVWEAIQGPQRPQVRFGMIFCTKAISLKWDLFTLDFDLFFVRFLGTFFMLVDPQGTQIRVFFGRCGSFCIPENRKTPPTVWPGRGVPKVANYGDFFSHRVWGVSERGFEALKRFWRSAFGPKLEQKKDPEKGVPRLN